MTKKPIDAQQLKAVYDVIADTNRGLTKTELSQLLIQCQIMLVDDGNSNNGYTYTTNNHFEMYLPHVIDEFIIIDGDEPPDYYVCLLYTSPSPRDGLLSR